MGNAFSKSKAKPDPAPSSAAEKPKDGTIADAKLSEDCKGDADCVILKRMLDYNYSEADLAHLETM